ncbi:MAG: GH25 family lysozyme, partial [Eubacteriales bacterium]|nr:GH25 family lysozyme [Eubacteriales bacterium]
GSPADEAAAYAAPAGEEPPGWESEKPTESESQKPSEPEKPSEAVKVTGVTVTADPARAESGKTVKLKAAVSLSDGSSYSGSISWSADGGSLTASGAEASLTSSDPRKVTVTAAAEGTKGSVTVEFFKEDRKVTGLKLPDKVSVAVGETVSLSLTVEPKDASNKETEWKLVEGDGVISLENGKVKGKKAGTARVKAVAKDGSNVSSNECTVTVELKDSKAPLKDKNGAQLYRKDGDTYREATAADYYSKEKLYRKKESGQYRYTGWQTIDGRRYYFDKNGNPVTGDQVIQGMKYSFNSDGSMKTGSVMGIDVSRHNGNVDWNAVKASGVDFVILRCGYRGSSTGALIEDQTFRKNIKGASAAGLKIGVYVFSQAVNSVEAVEEASLALSLVQGYKLTYPIFIDVESANGRADGLSAAARTQIITSFCQTVQNSGYKAGIYANKTWLSSKMNVGALGNYRIWLAQYAAAPTYGGRYEMWQYSSQGSIPGISGHVDLNVSYLGY